MFKKSCLKAVKLKDSPTLSELTKQLELLTKQFDHITTTAKSVIIRLQKIYVKPNLPPRAASSSDLYNQMNDESYLKAINRSVSSCGITDLSSEGGPVKGSVSTRSLAAPLY